MDLQRWSTRPYAAIHDRARLGLGGIRPRGPALLSLAGVTMLRAPRSVIHLSTTRTPLIRRSTMKPRLHYAKHAPGIYEAMDALDQHLAKAAVDAKLLHLVRLRGSQLKGSAY